MANKISEASASSAQGRQERRPLVAALLQSVFVRRVGFTVAGQVGGLVVAMATSAITARLLGPKGRGQLSLALLLPGMLQLFLGFGLSVANVYYAGSDRIAVGKLTANSVLFSLLGTVGGGAIVLVLMLTGGLHSLVPGVPYTLLLIGLLALPISLLNTQLSAVLQGLQRIPTLNILGFAQAMLTLPLMALLVIGLRWSVPGALAATLIAQAAILIATACCLRRYGARFRPRWNTEVVRPTVKFGVKGYVGNLLQFFNYRLDTFIVNFYIGAAGVGIYGVAVALAELLWQLPNATGFVLFPKAANSSHATMNRFTPRVFWAVLAVTSMGALGMAVFGKLAIRIIYSGAFINAYVPLLVLLPGVVLLGAAKILANDIAGRGYPQYNSIISGSSLVLTVVLDFALIPRMGVVGASLASTVSYSLTLLLTLRAYVLVRSKGQEAESQPKMAAGCAV